jgi:hypothetical protein
MDLCLNDQLRNAFTADRNVLIIDEKVNFPIFTFSKAVYDEVRSFLDISIQPDFDKACNKLKLELQKQQVEKNVNKCIRCKPHIHPKTLQNFLELISCAKH